MKAKTFVIVAEVSPLDGSAMAAAIHQGYGENFVRSYLSTKMPAGSPVGIVRVVDVTTSPDSQD